jgi:cytochrome c biogenesis protein
LKVKKSMQTTGIELKTRRRGLAETVELLSSMRFAIALLVMLAIAAIIGTIMKQDQAVPDYINQFGPFWFAVFDKLGLYAVYSAWWFLLIFGVLMVSTSLCIARNAPRMLRDIRSWREHLRENSLRNFHHRAEWSASGTPLMLANRSAQRLAAGGYRVKIVDKEGGLLVAAKKGAVNKLGYIFAHTAMIVIPLGGLLDSNLPIRFQEWFMGKAPFNGGGLIAEIGPEHRLGLGNPTFRGNTMIPEGQSSATAIINEPDGVLVQDLPFTIHLNKFIIDFYSTGMPKLFASEVTIRDHETGQVFPATIKVNQPLIYRGVAVYQSSFEDGGSKLKLTGWPMAGAGDSAFPIEGEVGGATPLKQGAEQYSVEWSGFRPFNVENTSNGNDTRAVTKGQSLEDELSKTLSQHSGSAAKNANNKDLKNVGPSVQYKLRDKTGQAREFMNYMQPVTLDGAQVYLAGVRNNPSDPFSYLRIPADDQGSVREWMRLRAALADPGLREEAARRYAERAMPQTRDNGLLARQLQESSAKTLAIFAGEGTRGGFLGVADFLERIPRAEQEKAANVFMKMLNGSIWQLWEVAHAHALMAMSTQRKTLDFEREFEEWKTTLPQSE